MMGFCLSVLDEISGHKSKMTACIRLIFDERDRRIYPQMRNRKECVDPGDTPIGHVIKTSFLLYEM